MFEPDSARCIGGGARALIGRLEEVRPGAEKLAATPQSSGEVD